MYPTGLLLELMDRYPAAHPAHYTAAAALCGDPVAAHTLRDLLEEDGLMESPFKLGESYFICTDTLYYVGRVKRVSFGWLELEEASWVHWTGRLSVLLKERNFTSGKFGTRKPRTEFVGQVGISMANIRSYYGPSWDLPKRSVE